MSARIWPIHLLLFASGAAGLTYEVCWSRTLGLWLGRGERGAALTVVLFFLGMAGGYGWAARRSERAPRPLLLYAACEAVVGLWGLGVPSLSAWVPPERGGVLWAALLPATMAMGASLPFALETLARRQGSAQQAYAWQLAGATLGSLGTTFWTIDAWGVRGSQYAAVLVSASCALAAGLLRERKAVVPQVPAAASRSAQHLRLALAAGLAGLLTLAFQVLVLRLFAFTLQNSTYSFGLTLTLFILLLAWGSALASARVRSVSGAQRVEAARRLLARASISAALGVSSACAIFVAATHFGLLRAPSFGFYVGLAGGLATLLLAWPVSAAGMLLPALWASAEGATGRLVGLSSATNAIGSVLGALLASFFLLPSVGLFGSLSLVALGYLGFGVWMARAQRASVLLALLGAGFAAHVATYRVPVPDGFGLEGRWQSPFGLVDLLRSRTDGSLSARVDIHYQLGSSVDRARHVRMGRLGLALHEQPKRVLFIGLATGMTASAALAFPRIEHIEVVELIPEVAPLARRFAAHNGNLLRDPRVTLALDDGRAHLQRGHTRFDVIVSDLFVPWHSQTGYLYTVEHYRAARERLTERGLFVQWLPLSHVGEAELELIATSFTDVFPDHEAFLDDSDPARVLLGLVGAKHSRPATHATRDGFEVIGRYQATDHALRNTDDHPRVEFGAPRTERDGRLLRGGPALRAFLSRRFRP